MIRNVKPFALAVQRTLTIAYQCSHVVCVDADCLILEDLRQFLDANELLFVASLGMIGSRADPGGQGSCSVSE